MSGHKADHSLPSSVEVKNAWIYTSILPIRLHGVVLRDNFTSCVSYALSVSFSHFIGESKYTHTERHRALIKIYFAIPSTRNETYW